MVLLIQFASFMVALWWERPIWWGTVWIEWLQLASGALRSLTRDRCPDVTAISSAVR